MLKLILVTTQKELHLINMLTFTKIYTKLYVVRIIKTNANVSNIYLGGMLMKVISMVNNKGGVTKTSSTINLTYALTLLNKKVLMIDNDPQSSLTIYAGFEPLEQKKTMYDVMTEKCDITEAILRTNNHNIDILPSSIDLSAGETEISSKIGREFILREKLSHIKENYDYIVIDNTPSLGILTINAMIASDYIIAPIEPSYLAFRGMEILFETLNGIKKTLDLKIELMGVLVALFDGRIKHHQEILEELKKKYPVFGIIIKRSIKFSDSCLACKSIMEYAGMEFEGSQAYMKLAEEVINYGK